MARPAPFDVSHRYDTANPDAVIPLVPTLDARQSLSIFHAHGARHRFRLLRTRRGDGEPEYPHGDARYLDIDRDPVVPIYSLLQFQPDSWDIQVGHDKGGEPQIYPFRTKDDALTFQGLLTGYDTAASFEGVRVSVLHVPDVPGPSILKKFARLADHEAIGEVQLWQRKKPASGAGSAAGPRSVDSDTRRGSTARTGTSAGDAVSLQTDPVTNQGVYISDSPQSPVLAAFTRSGSGEVMMLKVDLSDMQVRLHGGLLELSRPKRAIFRVLRLSAKEDELAGWNICRFSAFATRKKDNVPGGGVGNEDSLDCSYITLKPLRSGEAEKLRRKILELRMEYLRAETARLEARGAALGNITPSVAGAAAARASSVSSGSGSFVGLPPLPAMSALDVTMNNDANARLELDANPQRAELDATTPPAGGSQPQHPSSFGSFRARLRRPLRKGRRRRGSQSSQDSQS